jgi:hypothetical protein
MSNSTVKEETKMAWILRIECNANKVFNIFKNISQKYPHMTLAEAGQKGLLEPKIQRTIPYELGKFPEVWLDDEIENN